MAPPEQPVQHVALLAGNPSKGHPVREVVPGRRRGDGHWELLGTPALVPGCAAGDVLAVQEDDGRFEVQFRGGNLGVVSYVPEGRDVTSAIESLVVRFHPLGGSVEVPGDSRFVVITVPVLVGFPAVEAEMERWQSETGLDWYFSNVYDEQDQQLGWWDDAG